MIESSASWSTRKLVREEGQGTPTNNPEPPSILKQMRSSDSLVEKKPEFTVALRIEGFAQDPILKDEDRMDKNPKVVDKLLFGYWTKSIIEVLENTEKSVKFSEDSSRTIEQLDNVELHELAERSRTVQCQSCLQDVPEGLIFCTCGMCLRPSEEQTQRIKTQFAGMKVPFYHARVNYSRGKRHGEAQWQKDNWKARDALQKSEKEQPCSHRAQKVE